MDSRLFYLEVDGELLTYTIDGEDEDWLVLFQYPEEIELYCHEYEINLDDVIVHEVTGLYD